MKCNKLSVKKKDLTKIAAVFTCTTIVSSTLSGCVKEYGVLKGTELYDTSVVTFADGNKDVAHVIGYCNFSCDNYDYVSLVNGTIYCGLDCEHGRTTTQTVHHYDIVKEEPITFYLTAEELEKAGKGDLSSEDTASIITRIVTSKEDTKTLELTKKDNN